MRPVGFNRVRNNATDCAGRGKSELEVARGESGNMQLVGILFRLGPLWFGLGFLAPVLAALLVALRVTPPLGLSPLFCGLIVGGVLGVIATIRRTWL
jgi:hypothetical protein